MVKNMQNKKRKRRARKPHIFDIKGIKILIENELYSQYSSNEIDKHKDIKKDVFYIRSKEEEEKVYSMKYSKYMLEEFNSKIVSMIVVFINRNKSFPDKYQTEPNFISKFINLLKHLLMNEFEIAYFTILLEKIGWSWQNVEHWTYFCILGIFIKKLCGKEEESSLLINIISRNNPDFMDFYTNWVCEEEIVTIIEEKGVSIREINERFRQLTRPINSYCRKNYTNYNGVADKIVKLSQPYGEHNNGKQIKYNEQLNSNNGIIDNIKLMSTVNEYYAPKDDFNDLKYNLIMKPMISNCIFNKKNNMTFIGSSQSKCSFDDININNPSHYNLNIYNNKSSQFSLKFDN